MDNFEEVYAKYFDDVYRYIRRLSGNEHLAEEITSDTFFRAMKSIGKFRSECDLRVWLCQIAKNCYCTRLKKERKSEPTDESELAMVPDLSASVEETILLRYDAMRARHILHTIPEPYKEVFLWRTYAELSFSQIGQIFAKNENWACVTYHRARKMIREKMEEKE